MHRSTMRPSHASQYYETLPCIVSLQAPTYSRPPAALLALEDQPQGGSSGGGDGESGVYRLAQVGSACLPRLCAALPACLQDRNDNSGTLIAIQWLIIGSLILTGICDLAAAYIVLAANKPTFTIWRWRWVGG